MQQQKEKGLRKFWIFVFLLIVAAALLFWLEWMGSEQQMTPMEHSIPLPAKAGNSD